MTTSKINIGKGQLPKALIMLQAALLSVASVAAQPAGHPGTSDTCESSYCSPGVKGMTPGSGLEVGVETLPGLTFQGPEGEKQNIREHKRMYAKVRFPIVVNPSLKLLGGLEVSRQTFDFKSGQSKEVLPSELDNRSLKASEFKLYGIKAFNERLYMGSKAAVSFKGDYPGFSNIDGNQMDASLALLLGIKTSNNTEYGFGFIQSYWNNDYSIFPVLRYNKTLGDFGIEALLPSKLYVRYNFSSKSVLYVGTEYYGKEYRLNGNYGRSRRSSIQYDNSAVRFQANFEQRLLPWVWVNGKFGYQTSLGFSFQSNGSNDRAISSNQPGGIYSGIELSLRLPD